jgi:hypothetical protein
LSRRLEGHEELLPGESTRRTDVVQNWLPYYMDTGNEKRTITLSLAIN